MYCQNYGEYKSSNKVPYRSLYMVLVYDNRIHTIKYNIFEPYRNKYPNIVWTLPHNINQVLTSITIPM